MAGNLDNGGAGCVGKVDRIIRVVLAAVLLGFAFICPWAQSLGPVVVWGSGLVGVVLIGTAVLARCPLYRVLGIHT